MIAFRWSRFHRGRFRISQVVAASESHMMNFVFLNFDWTIESNSQVGEVNWIECP